MSAPVCPVHGSPMKQGRRGFFCPRTLADGSYCKQTATAEQAAAPAATPVIPAQQQEDLRAIAALDAASRVYQGSSDPQAFLDLANQIMAGFWGGGGNSH